MCLLRFVLPESPRWLAVQGKYDEVLKLLHKMCKRNCKELPKDFHPSCLVDKVINYY